MNNRFSPVCLLPLLLASAAYASPLKATLPELPATAVNAVAAPKAAAAAAIAPAAAAAPAVAAVPAAAVAPAAVAHSALASALAEKPAVAELLREAEAAQAQAASRKFMCQICGYVYDEAKGDPANGIAPGTKWEDVPADWVCPECGESKESFAEDMVEVR